VRLHADGWKTRYVRRLDGAWPLYLLRVRAASRDDPAGTGANARGAGAVNVRPIAIGLGALIVLGLGAAALTRNTKGTDTRPSTRAFFAEYVEPDGRVVRHDHDADTVSEGQAYALLLAVASGDRHRFTTVWNWTTAHLQRDDELFAWHWHNGEVVDQSSASDADLDIAHALALAIERFGLNELRGELRALSDSILVNETVTVGDRRVLVAGNWAKGERVVNPSYFSPCAYTALARATRDDRWNQLTRSSSEMLDAFARAGSLPPDWAVVDAAGAAHATGRPDSGDDQPQYGLDAMRIPLRLAPCDTAARAVAARFWPALKRLPRGGAAVSYSLDGRALTNEPHALGLLAASAAATSGGDEPAATRLLRDARHVEGQDPSYYGSAWLALHDQVFEPKRAP
jgi:endoglucanase